MFCGSRDKTEMKGGWVRTNDHGNVGNNLSENTEMFAVIKHTFTLSDIPTESRW